MRSSPRFLSPHLPYPGQGTPVCEREQSLSSPPVTFPPARLLSRHARLPMIMKLREDRRRQVTLQSSRGDSDVDVSSLPERLYGLLQGHLEFLVRRAVSSWSFLLLTGRTDSRGNSR